MLTDLILVRHGNTFAPGDSVVWVGARTDLPLTPSGVDQAVSLGKRLRELSVRPTSIRTGPLLRTKAHAELLVEHAGLECPISIDERLREIDFGQWEGLTSAQISALGFGTQLQQWDAESIWPRNAGWSPSETTILENVRVLLQEVATATDDGTTMVVTSNGILRFFARNAMNCPSPSAIKVRTGAYCRMTYINGSWQIIAWNQDATQVSSHS